MHVFWASSLPLSLCWCLTRLYSSPPNCRFTNFSSNFHSVWYWDVLTCLDKSWYCVGLWSRIAALSLFVLIHLKMFGRRLHDENIVLNIEKLSEWWQEKNEGFSIDFSETFTRPLRPGKELPWWEFVQKFLSLLRFFSKALKLCAVPASIFALLAPYWILKWSYHKL